jgi:hypothetical protein
MIRYDRLFERGGTLTTFLNLDDYLSLTTEHSPCSYYRRFCANACEKDARPGHGPPRSNMEAGGLQRLKTSADLSMRRSLNNHYDRPVSPQRERDVGSNIVACLPSGEASQSFSS